MRQMLVLAPRGSGKRALDIAAGLGGTNLAYLEATGTDGSWDLALINAPNRSLDTLVDRLEQLGEVHLTLIPQGVLPLHPPPERAPEQVMDVTPRSPIEIFLSGLQSIGSWQGFLGYAASAGIVVWIGLFTETVFLLVAAMLIAPFAGPAMNLAMGTARGDSGLVLRSAGRYFASLAVSVAVAWALSTAVDQRIATRLMVDTALISSVTVLLPLVAGAAGALNLAQSERNSLVTAAGPGILVAASLAPPAGLIGMAAAIGDLRILTSGLYVLLLQLVGINLAGSAVFSLFGLRPEGPRYPRGRPWVRTASAALTLVALAGLLAWQFSGRPELQRSTVEQRVTAEVREAVTGSGEARLVEAEVRFTRPDVPGRSEILVIAYVLPAQGSASPDQALDEELTSRIRERVVGAGFGVTPLVEVVVVRSGP